MSAPGVSSKPHRDVIGLLERGELEPLSVLPQASNYSFLARVREGTLCQREVAAYVLAESLGWPKVPQTVLRDGPQGIGSVQRFVAFDPNQHYFTMREERADEFRRVALFDIVANNADRKAGHCLLAETGDIFVVDHGVCFSDEPKLRTVIWDFVEEPIPEAMLADLRALQPRLNSRAARDRLAALLSTGEVRAMEQRLADLIMLGRFPEPGPGRPYPWPIV